MKHKMHKLVCVTAVAALCGGTALAAPPLPPQTRPVPGSQSAGNAPTSYAMETSHFLRTMAYIDAFQHRAVGIAVRRAKSDRVRDFARNMLKFHVHSYADLVKLEKMRASLPPKYRLPLEYAFLLNRLKKAGANFDKVFVDSEVLVLKTALGPLETYATGGVDGTVRQAAAEAITADKAALVAAQNLQNQGLG